MCNLAYVVESYDYKVHLTQYVVIFVGIATVTYCVVVILIVDEHRWSPRGRPRGHILKSLALASKPQVLENWPVLGSRTALFLNC